MKIYTSIVLLCCLSLTLAIPGCLPVTVLKLRAIKTSSDTSDTGRERETRKSVKSALKLKELYASHPGGPSSGDTQGRTTQISFEVRSRGDEIWTLKATQCKLLAYTYADEDKSSFKVTNESAVHYSFPFPAAFDASKVEEFVIKPQEVVGSNLGFETEGYDFCVLVLPFVSETGESLVFELLYSADRLPRKTIDKFKSGLDA